MQGMPKVIGTGQDLYNLLGLVQAGAVTPGELGLAIEGIEARKYIFTLIVSISEDKRYITTNYMAEAAKGASLVCQGKEYTIKSVEHVTEPREQTEVAEEIQIIENKKTIIGVDADIEETAITLGVENPINVLENMGIIQDDINNIKGVLAKYE
ncbi:MAG: hypothetical protein ACERKZ_03225 [Lachnotalea sp.]